jgi:hypothetical protein
MKDIKWPEGAQVRLNDTFTKWVDGVEYFYSKDGKWIKNHNSWSLDEFKESGNFKIIERPIDAPYINDGSTSSKYSTPIGDVYDVLKAFEVTNPALQHLIKKALKVGNRGHKDIATDLQDIIDSAVRAKELEGF